MCGRVATKFLTSPFSLLKTVTNRATSKTSYEAVKMNYTEYNLNCKVLSETSNYHVMMDFPNGPIYPSVIKN